MYDWANSVYSLVITTAIFPVYYNEVTSGVDGSGVVAFFGRTYTNTVLYSYSLSFSFLLIAILSPLLSGIADFGGLKKPFMKFFTYLGGISCIMLFFFTGENVEYGITFSVLASIGFSGSIVFYNAYLPVICSPDKYDMVSAKGFSYGYFGSVLLLIVSLGSIMGYDLIGLPDKGIATKISFGLVGIWWIGFAQITFYYLPPERHRNVPVSSLLKNGYNEILKVWKSLKGMASTKFFLSAFFFYNTGVQTVIYLATIFGSKELNLPTEDLILAVLIIQVVAIGGSYLFAKISTKKGNKFSLVIMISIWITVCLYAYFLHTATQFYILAVIVGMVMGGIQALSRATYSKLIPKNTISPTSYFSFYDVLEKVSIFTGTFAYGLIEHITGSMRNSTLALAFFFIAGMIFLIFVAIPKPSESERAGI